MARNHNAMDRYFVRERLNILIFINRWRRDKAEAGFYGWKASDENPNILVRSRD